MNKLHYLPSFEADAADIWLFVADRNPISADQLIDRLYERCLMLKEHPFAGPARPDIAEECRHLLAGPILVLYRVAGHRVELVRALYRGRNITTEAFSGQA